MKKILVPTDFSPNADKALDFAVQIARQAKAEIILLHVCYELDDTSFKDKHTLYKEYNQKTIDEANENLLLLKKTIEDTEKFSVKIQLYKGTVTDTILHASEEHHADLIIMGTLGDSDIEEKIFGSKTARIIGKTNVPVMAVPRLSEWNIPNKILLAVNNFEEEPDIINPVFELAGLFNATVHIAIFTDVDSAQTIDYLKHKKSITAYVEKLKTRYKSTDVKLTYLYGHTFQESIEEYMNELRIDIVAMVTNKQTFMECIFNRGMEKKMYYNTRIPLLAIPAKKVKSLYKKTIENESEYSNAWL